MTYDYQCPNPNCEYSAEANDTENVVEDAQQHHQDKHGDSATRDDVEERTVGP